MMLVALSLLALACGGEEEAVTPALTPTPVLPFTTDTTRLSPSARQALVDLAVSHQKITEDWEELHLDFDRWREGLLECDAASMRVSLRQFAGDLAEITALARSLPRHPNVRELGDKLIGAAEEQEKSLRELRDGWAPDAIQLFESVDLQGAAAATVRNEVEDQLLELNERTSSSSRSLVAAFSQALEEVDSLWDEFHDDYDQFRTVQPGLSSGEVATRLGELVSQFNDLVVQTRSLPTSEITRSVAQILTNAAAEEELALRRLRDAVDQGLSDEQAFNDFDAEVVDSNTSRREAAEKLADIVEDSSGESQSAVQEFSISYLGLASTWEEFDRTYEAWTRTEGGCDRSQALETLAQFSVRFSQLAKEVRALPRLQILEPFGEVLVQAAEGEESALRALRNNWRPFDASVYDVFEQGRSTSGQLRRQVAAALNQLLTQYDISLEEPAP
ncbi:MAG: hypothetical protein ACE5KI_01910 [Dehalococcoidia bacterium]